MQRKKLFNVSGNDDITNRRMVGGNVTNLFNLNNVKYQWANKLYRLMMENFWIPEKVSLFDDKRAYDELTPAEQKAYDGILSFLVFLDSIQTNNLPNISDYITAPEVNLILAIQTYQEAVHSQSYAYIIESIIPAAKREEIYNKWREDKVLLERNKYIAEIYQDFIDNRNDKNFARVLVANFLLEGLYFYNGFNFFYNLAARSLMIGTADEIKYINRDELTHCVIFANIIKEIRQERHDFFNDDEIYEMFAKATEQEINWSNHIIGNRVMGITPETIEQYTKFMANKRLKEIGMQPLFEGFDSDTAAKL
jgi:ribonucleoside-diphosphate reductase beta chain